MVTSSTVHRRSPIRKSAARSSRIWGGAIAGRRFSRAGANKRMILIVPIQPFGRPARAGAQADARVLEAGFAGKNAASASVQQAARTTSSVSPLWVIVALGGGPQTMASDIANVPAPQSAPGRGRRGVKGLHDGC